MLHGWLEELVDTLLYLGIIMGLLLFSACYWKDSYQLRCAETATEEFLNIVAADGKIMAEGYEGLAMQLLRINDEYEVEISCRGTVLRPCYGLIPEELLNQYYMKRNIRKKATFVKWNIPLFENAVENLRLQEETNASLLAGMEQYLPLLGEKAMQKVEAVLPKQEIYEGEEIITLCRVFSDMGIYYAEAELNGFENGTARLCLVTANTTYYVPVEVIYHPREVVCENGHAVINTRQVIEKFKQTGSIECFYCLICPQTVRCEPQLLQRKTGSKLTKEELCLEVCYLDGHVEEITPDSEEWQDDYDENYCGIQNVTVCYRGMEDSVIIISENNNCKNCRSACNERNYSDYEKFPYCVKCMSQVPLFTGKTVEEEQGLNYEELILMLNEKKEVLLEFGDYVTIKIKKNGICKSMLQKVVRKDGKYR